MHSNEINSRTKSNKKKPSKKPKIAKTTTKTVYHSIKPPKTIGRSKPKTPESTHRYHPLTKAKKNNSKAESITTTTTTTATTVASFDGSPYFYAINTNKYKNSEESVKPYLKFVKNITITYPVIIPARDNVKYRESVRKPQKQKEKSRDLNSNRNLNQFTSKPLPTSAITARGKTTGNLRCHRNRIFSFFLVLILHVAL